MFNKVILFGRLSEAPDFYTGRNNLAACRLRVETRTAIPWRSRQHREWTTVRVFGAQAERVRFLKKGALVTVEGALCTRPVGPGGDRSVTEILGTEVRALEGADGAAEEAA